MAKFSKINSRFCLLFITVLILFINCEGKKVKDDKIYFESNINAENQKNKKLDSIEISINLKPNMVMGFNMFKRPFDETFFEIENLSNKDSLITKKIANNFGYQIIKHKAYIAENSDVKILEDYFLIGTNYTKLNFDYNNGILKLKNDNKNLDLNKMFADYNTLESRMRMNINKCKSCVSSTLDSLYNENKRNFVERDTILSKINHLNYINLLQKLEPFNKKIDSALNEGSQTILSSLNTGILFNYVKNRIDSINFDSLIISKEHSTYYKERLSMGMYRFLKHEDNKGDRKYDSAVDWFLTTEFYKRDSLYIKKQIIPLDNKKFKTNLVKLKFFNIEDNELNLSQIIQQNPNRYYLIDFWATWCAPCIQGVKAMKQMNLPKNVSVISISVDKEKDKEKWTKMTSKLEQPITYWLDETKEETKQFVKFIEMQSIPRYILIDKNMNLIDQAFYHPQEPQFLPKLQDVRNHKYW